MISWILSNRQSASSPPWLAETKTLVFLTHEYSFFWRFCKSEGNFFFSLLEHWEHFCRSSVVCRNVLASRWQYLTTLVLWVKSSQSETWKTDFIWSLMRQFITHNNDLCLMLLIWNKLILVGINLEGFTLIMAFHHSFILLCIFMFTISMNKWAVYVRLIYPKSWTISKF